jgi:hypothetical protein
VLFASLLGHWTSNITLNKETLFEAWIATKPSITHMKIFGRVCYVHVLKGLHGKLDSKSKLRLFMGYFDESKVDWIWDVMKWRIMVSRDVVATLLLEEWEDDIHTPEMGTRNRNFRVQLQGSKHLALKCSLYHWKVIKV